MAFGNFRIHDRWSIWTETQFRSHDIGIGLEQFLLRSAVNYHFSKNVIASAGCAHVGNYLPGTEIGHPRTEENRIYQQFMYRHLLPRVFVQHRLRTEQRWVESRYRTRYRYRLHLTVPLNSKNLEEKTLFAGLYDEVFLNGQSHHFDRNRFYFALGYQFNEYTNMQAGVMNQLQMHRGKWYLQLSVAWSPDLRKD